MTHTTTFEPKMRRQNATAPCSRRILLRKELIFPCFVLEKARYRRICDALGICCQICDALGIVRRIYDALGICRRICDALIDHMVLYFSKFLSWFGHFVCFF